MAEKEQKESKPKQRYKLLSGTHVDKGSATEEEKKGQGPRVYEAGEIVESTEELDKIFLNKFEKVNGEGKGKKKKKGEEGEEEEGAKEEGEPLGDDVTEKFPEAKDAGLMVFKEGRHYFVATASDPTTALNDDEELTTQEAVNDFIEDYMEEETKGK